MNSFRVATVLFLLRIHSYYISLYIKDISDPLYAVFLETTLSNSLMELLQSMYNSDSDSNPKEVVAPSAIIFYLIVLLMHIFIVSMNGVYNISQFFPIQFDSI